MIVTFVNNTITATPDSAEELDTMNWLSQRIDSIPLIRFHLEALIKQRTAQRFDEIGTRVVEAIKSGQISKEQVFATLDASSAVINILPRG